MPNVEQTIALNTAKAIEIYENIAKFRRQQESFLNKPPSGHENTKFTF